MRALIILVAFLVAIPARAGDSPARVVVHLLDPRVVALTDNTISIEWKNAKTDIIATRTLTVSEGRQLRALLTKELADDDNVPFCGHSPAYAVSVAIGDRAPIVVTLCAKCGTWAKQGQLKALHGKSALSYLESLLPLPDVFQPVDGKLPEILDSFDERRKRPFYLLDVSDNP